MSSQFNRTHLSIIYSTQQGTSTQSTLIFLPFGMDDLGVFALHVFPMYFLGGTSGKEPACQCRKHKWGGFDSRVGKFPWSRKGLPTPSFLLKESHEQRSLVCYSPQGCKVIHDWSNLALSTCPVYGYPTPSILKSFSRIKYGQSSDMEGPTRGWWFGIQQGWELAMRKRTV